MVRHDRVYLHPGSAFATDCVAKDGASWAAVARWIALGHPLVAARQADAVGELRLGLTLPLSGGRQRITVRVAPATVMAVSPPLLPAHCLAHLADAPAAALQRLQAAIEAAGGRVGVYGSLAWESLSGEAYRQADSDIDVICDVATRTQLDRMLAALSSADAELPCALDGEIRFPDGHAVAWREVATGLERSGARVLAKGESAVSLLPLADLLSTLMPEHCHV